MNNNDDQYGCGGYIKHDDYNDDIVHQNGDHENDIVTPTMIKTMALIKKMKMIALVKQMKMINQLMVMKMIKKLATSGRPAGSN